ncbi:MAG: glycosyltransferase family 2 protein [Eubacteriales bacterium]|nr:glycosyltransferase family 2 protein [Eubacteriales bacterium]
MPKVLVIIPAYNEEAAILGTVADLRAHCPDADCIVVNDCSRDRTRAILQEHGIPYLDLPLNLGIGGGVQTGYRYALAHDYDIAVQFDGDGQHQAAYLRPLIQPILDGAADMTIGSRFIPREGEDKGFQSSALRRAGINMLSALIRLVTGQTLQDVTSGFRACGRDLIALFAEHYAQDYPEPEAIVTATVSGYRVREVPVLMNERQGGVSSIRALKSVFYMVKVSLAIVLAGLRLSSRKELKRHA